MISILGFLLIILTNFIMYTWIEQIGDSDWFYFLSNVTDNLTSQTVIVFIPFLPKINKPGQMTLLRDKIDLQVARTV